EEDFAGNTIYSMGVTAQVTPALAAIVPGARLLVGSRAPPALAPSESIGPMQGAILSTLLPLLALKPLDERQVLLSNLSGYLKIPTRNSKSEAPVAVALALEGHWSKDKREQLVTTCRVMAGGVAELVWHDQESRVLLFLQALERNDA